ncbi:hypothetical protein Maes01_01515 [Microbulbifer aestuariivivens]|uniref:Uncharacterized protein n=1 Tax=Microbulbifer aestuariivivens TaxID=1908308 RepID=A0ABP9WPC9_9GAMM
MAGKKHKHRQRPQQRGGSSDLLDELNSLRDLLGTDDLSDIPLLDQVAQPGPKAPHQAMANRPGASQPGAIQPAAKQQPLDADGLPILFSPVDAGLAEGFHSDLNAADGDLLGGLQDLPTTATLAKAVTVDSKPVPAGAEQQSDLFDAPALDPAENPFLPAHIRARLTGGRVPRGSQLNEGSTLQSATIDTRRELTPSTQLPSKEGPETEQAGADQARQTESPDRERAQQRQKLVDRLVASQLPELERRLRARIEMMIDELEAKR